MSYKKLSLQRYLERASKSCRSKFQYFMNPDADLRRSTNNARTSTDGGTSESTVKGMIRNSSQMN